MFTSSTLTRLGELTFLFEVSSFLCARSDGSIVVHKSTSLHACTSKELRHPLVSDDSDSNDEHHCNAFDGYEPNVARLC